MIENRSINPSPPGLSGLAWRVMTPADLPALVELGRECLRLDGGLPFLFEPAQIQARYFADGSGTCIGAFAPGGRMAASAAVHLSGTTGSPQAVIIGQVRPDMRSQGIGAYLIHWSQAQAKALLAGATLPAADVHPGKMQISTESLTEPAHRLYIKHGYERVFDELVMRRDLALPMPEAPFPEDIAISTWQPDLVEAFYQAYHAAFRERPGFPGWNIAEWVEHETDEDTLPEWTLLARAGDEPAGFVLGGTDPTTQPPSGFITQIGVVPAQRRRGLASALLVEVMRRMRSAGTPAVMLTVNTNNPGAIEAYKQLRFVSVGRRARYEKAL